MTWDAYNRRKSALREVVAIVDARRDLTPTDLLDRVDPQREAFADESELLREAQLAWFQRLSGTLDRFGGVEETPESTAVTAWVDAAAQMPGVRSLLDAHLDAPVLATAVVNERVMMAAVSGVPMHHPDAAAHGERIIDSARERAVYPITAPDAETTDENGFAGLVARLKSALAA